MNIPVQPYVQQAKENAIHYYNAFQERPRHQRIVAAVGAAAVAIMALLVAIFHSSILKWLSEISAAYRDWTYGWLLIFFAVICVSFPPIFGYTLTCVFTGMVYGVFRAWLLLAVATCAGATISFIVFRHLFKERAKEFVKSPKFAAFAETMQEDKLTLLWLLRLCPLPFSLSNAAMSSVHTIELWKFFMATLLSTPKILIPAFVGDRIASLGEGASVWEFWLNILSIGFASVVGVVTTWLLYKKMQERVPDGREYDLDDDPEYDLDNDGEYDLGD